MSLVENILTELWNTELNYKGVRVNIFGIPRLSSKNYNSLKSTAYQLKKNGLIDKDENGWFITKKGKECKIKKYLEFKNFESPFKDGAPKNLLLMFDVPSSKNSERNWLRKQLRSFDYIMVQKSVWVGPSPLPKEFVDYVKKIGIEDGVKTFKLAKDYSLHSKYKR
ncbi:MAG: CRISPR-associated endonuclease Cas2 [Candidatus Paceibacterota bacterium]